MSNIIYLSIKGKTQVLISEGCGSYASIGNKYQINHVDEIFVLQFDHSLSREYNVVHHPIKFYKPIDKSSPLLMLLFLKMKSYQLYLIFIELILAVVLKGFTQLNCKGHIYRIF